MLGAMSKKEIAVFWFRRDLRLEDNTGLFHALQSGYQVLPIFIFDQNILSKLQDKDDRRVTFIHTYLDQIHQQLQKIGSGIRFFFGKPEEAFQNLFQQYDLKAIFTNHDYEPYASERDAKIGAICRDQGAHFHTLKDQVIFEKEEIVTANGLPYTVFTPYSKRWKAQFRPELVEPRPSENLLSSMLKWEALPIIPLEEMGFVPASATFPDKIIKPALLSQYAEKRNFPALPATSRLSVHLRFGTISIRACVAEALKYSDAWLNELIWREFYMQILWNFPQIGLGKAFKPAYDRIPWRHDPEGFERWCMGKTGYPIVDAGMRELLHTGFMHNRVRMIVASFLVKHLLIDWRLGEAWFARKLLDFDLAANNGGWQWAAGSGCDAAPYFRVFNPLLQTEKFDKSMAYIKKWVPECNQLAYLQQPIVNHEFARKRVLEVYKEALGQPANVSS